MQVKKIFDNPFYTQFQKHYCPKCSTEMETIKVSKVVSSNSSEAKNLILIMEITLCWVILNSYGMNLSV